MVNAQLTFDYAEPKPCKARHLAARMIAVLTKKARWVTRKEFFEEHGFSRDGRQCRAGREASHGRILAGQKGYKLTRFATIEEIAEARNFFVSQKRAAEKEMYWLDKRGHEGVAGRKIA